MPGLRIAILTAAALVCVPAHAQLYKCTKDGKVAYQDSPCPPEVAQKQLQSIYVDPTGAGPGGMELVDVEGAARRIGAQQAAATVVVLYSSKCGICQQLMPQVSDLARRFQGRPVAWQVYSVDAPEDVGNVAAFLGESRAPFPPVAIRPWAPGQLTRAFASIGLTLDAQPWTRPYVAVRDRAGKVAYQAEGVADASQVAGTVEALVGREASR